MAVDESAKRPFASASHAQWRQLAQKTLRDKTSEDLDWTTQDGVRVAALHVREDLVDLPHLSSGAASLLRRARPRAVRQLIDAATPSAARRLVEQSLRGGAEQLLIRLDRLVHAGIDPLTYDPGWEEIDIFEHDAGSDGCAIYHLSALETVLESVDMSSTRVAFDAGAGSLPLLCMLFAIAERRGLVPSDLRIELGLDPIHELTRGAPVGHSHHDLLDEISIAVGNTAELPHFVPLAVHSAGLHEAGASAAIELGYSIATGIEYVRHLLSDDTGLEIDADTACASLCFRFHVDTELYVEIAKLRAARLLWAKVAHRFGAKNGQIEIHAESSARSRARDDVHTNLLRTGLHGFAATLANCDSITLAAFDQSRDEGAEFAQSLARNQQILLREESHLHRVQDPCGGSYSVESLTDAIGREAWKVVAEIEAEGGILCALRAGTIQARVRASADLRRDDFQHRRRTLVGINRFVEPGISRAECPEPDFRQIQEALDEYLDGRDADAIEAVLAEESIDSIEAAKAGCTIGEMITILRGEFDLALEVPFLETGSDGEPFEQLRELVVAAGLRVLPILAGPTTWSRARHDFARDYFNVGGFEVLPPHEQFDVDAVRALDPDLVVLCSDDASHPDLVAQLPTELRIVIAGRPRDEIADSVAAFIHSDDNCYLTLRSLYLDASEAGEAPEDREDTE